MNTILGVSGFISLKQVPLLFNNIFSMKSGASDLRVGPTYASVLKVTKVKEIIVNSEKYAPVTKLVTMPQVDEDKAAINSFNKYRILASTRMESRKERYIVKTDPENKDLPTSEYFRKFYVDRRESMIENWRDGRKNPENNFFASCKYSLSPSPSTLPVPPQHWLEDDSFSNVKQKVPKKPKVKKNRKVCRPNNEQTHKKANTTSKLTICLETDHGEEFQIRAVATSKTMCCPNRNYCKKISVAVYVVMPFIFLSLVYLVCKCFNAF